MKKFNILFILVLASVGTNAQNPATDTIVPAKGDIKGSIERDPEKGKRRACRFGGQPTQKIASIDSTKFSRYGDLLNDDPGV